MKLFGKAIRAAAIVLAIAAGSMHTKPAKADGGAVVAGIAGGLILGTLIGSSAHASPSYGHKYYAPAPTYYSAPAPQYYAPAPVYQTRPYYGSSINIGIGYNSGKHYRGHKRYRHHRGYRHRGHHYGPRYRHNRFYRRNRH